MGLVGAAQAMSPLLIGAIFDRVLAPASAEAPVLLFTIPIWQHSVFLQDFMPAFIHNVWTMVAVAILTVVAIKGVCDYAANYLVNYVGLSAVTDLRQEVFDRVVRQGAQFTGSLGPNRTTTGTPKAAAICAGPLSLPMNSCAPAIRFFTSPSGAFR